MFVRSFVVIPFDGTLTPFGGSWLSKDARSNISITWTVFKTSLSLQPTIWDAISEFITPLPFPFFDASQSIKINKSFWFGFNENIRGSTKKEFSNLNQA